MRCWSLLGVKGFKYEKLSFSSFRKVHQNPKDQKSTFNRPHQHRLNLVSQNFISNQTSNFFVSLTHLRANRASGEGSRLKYPRTLTTIFGYSNDFTRLKCISRFQAVQDLVCTVHNKTRILLFLSEDFASWLYRSFCVSTVIGMDLPSIFICLLTLLHRTNFFSSYCEVCSWQTMSREFS